MRIPTKGTAGWAREIIDACSVSRDERIQRGAMYRNMYLTGDDTGDPQTFPLVTSHIQTLASMLYSPVELRFGIKHYGMTPPVQKAMADSAAVELNSRIVNGNVDTEIEECVEWALVKGKCFVKLLWGENGFDPYIVQPELMGVLREDLNTLDRQEAFFHSSYYTPDRFAQLIEYLPDKDNIMRKISKYADPGKSSDPTGQANQLKQVILGGMNPYQQAGNSSTKNKGIVDWLGGPVPNMSPEVMRSLIRLDELWVWDDARDDWTTMQSVGNDVLLYGKDHHSNLFADMYDPDSKPKSREASEDNPLTGHHPFIEFCPNRLDGYFWGRSELCNVAILQKSINSRINGINALLRRQEDPPYFFSGMQGGIKQNDFAKLKKPGGYLVDNSPQATAKSLAPELPQTLFESLHEYEQMFNTMAGMPDVMRGKGDSGVRAGGHAETLTRNAAPRFKDRALLVERQVAELGGLALDILKAKVGYQLLAWVPPSDHSILTQVPPENELEDPPVAGMKPVAFILNQLPPNCKVVVDSHSSSPAFSHDTRALLFDLFKAGAVKPERLVEHTNPPGAEEMMQDLIKAEIDKAAFAQAHPELAAEEAAHGKKKKK